MTLITLTSSKPQTGSFTTKILFQLHMPAKFRVHQIVNLINITIILSLQTITFNVMAFRRHYRLQ
jgi:hypothetical protein